jgi:hypothetical protein
MVAKDWPAAETISEKLWVDGPAPTQTAVTIQVALTAALGGADGAALATGAGAGAMGVLAATKAF